MDPVVVTARSQCTYTRTMFIDITERVLMEQRRPALRPRILLAGGNPFGHDFTEIVGNSPALRAVLKQIEQIASTVPLCCFLVRLAPERN